MSPVKQTQLLKDLLSFHLETFADHLRHVMSTRPALGGGLIEAGTQESTKLPQGHSSSCHLTNGIHLCDELPQEGANRGSEEPLAGRVLQMKSPQIP